MPVVCGRGAQSILRARGRWPAWSAGPSTSPLEAMMFHTFTAVLALGLVTLVSAATPADYTVTSIYALIAAPEKYEGKVVRLIGFVRLEFEGTAVYAHREDYERGITANALWLSTKTCPIGHGEPFNNSYAVVEGTFTATNRGHMDMFSGNIYNITRCDAWRHGL